MNKNSPFLKIVRRMGDYAGPWQEECPDENRWYFTRIGKHSITYATVNWQTHRVTFKREKLA